MSVKKETMEVYENTTLQDFKEQIKHNRRPLLLKNVDIGACKEKWTVDFLAEVLGSNQVKVHVCPVGNMRFIDERSKLREYWSADPLVNKNFTYKTLEFKDFIKRAAAERHMLVPPINLDSDVDSQRNSRKNLDPKDYLIEQLTNDVTCKLPGSIKGEQFIIQNCSHSQIYVLDHCDSVLIDECDHCKIIIGPTKGSVFIRNVKNSVFIIACGQFRASNCYNMSVFLLCATVATVEAVSSIYLSCFQLYYMNLEEQFRAAGLSVYNNKWSSVYDFTPRSGEANVKIMADELRVEEFFPRSSSQFESLDLTFDRISSVVPFTYSIKALDSGEPCIIVFLFSSSQQEDSAKLFVRGMQFFENSRLLYTSKSILAKKDSANLIRTFIPSMEELTSEDTVTLIYSGPEVLDRANQVMDEIGLSPELYRIVSDADVHGLAQKLVATAAFMDS